MRYNNDPKHQNRITGTDIVTYLIMGLMGAAALALVVLIIVVA